METASFFSTNLDLICVTTPNGTILQTSLEFERLLGYSDQELLDKNILPYLGEPDTSSVLNTILTSTFVISFSNPVVCKNGSIKHIEWKSQALYGNLYFLGRDITSLVLENKEYKEEIEKLKTLTTNLEDLAGKDKLTDLYNRYSFESRIYSEMDRSDRYDIPLSILTFDLDFFKKVNDTFGHPVGDEVLKWASKIAQSNIRKTDVAFRIGGEEFAIMMPQTNIVQAEFVAEKIRHAIEQEPHPKAGRITASFGVAERFKGETFKSWYRRFDEALYSAKSTGRNKVVCYKDSEPPILSLNITWDEKLNSGNKIIDEQHKKLLDITISLFDSFYKKEPPEFIQAQIDLLIKHIKVHFAQEVDILRKKGYSEVEKHQEIHHNLEKKLQHLYIKYCNGDVKASVFYSFVFDEVIMEHLEQEDVKFFSLFSA